MTPNDIAKTVYRAVGWYYSFRDAELVWLTWDELSSHQKDEWERLISDRLDSIERGCNTAEEVHNDWANNVWEFGWKYGDELDEEAETHPLLVPFDWLSDDQQALDCMEFTMADMLSEEEVSGVLVANMAYDAAFIESNLFRFGQQVPPAWFALGDNVRDLFLTCGADVFSGGMVHPVSFHQRWSERMLQDGWNWGPMRDEDRRSEPLILPFSSLPLREQLRFYVACSCFNCFVTGG